MFGADRWEAGEFIKTAVEKSMETFNFLKIFKRLRNFDFQKLIEIKIKVCLLVYWKPFVNMKEIKKPSYTLWRVSSI